MNLTFNERVTVHSVPPYDPSRFSYVPEFDPVDNSGGGNCRTFRPPLRSFSIFICS